MLGFDGVLGRVEKGIFCLEGSFKHAGGPAFDGLLGCDAALDVEDLIEIVEVLVGDELIDVSELVHDLLDCLRVGRKDSRHFVVDLLQVRKLHLAQLTVPIAVPVGTLYLLFFASLHLRRLLQVGMQLIDRLALVYLKKFLHNVDDSLRNGSKIVVAEMVVRVEFYLLLQFLELLGHFLLFAEGSQGLHEEVVGLHHILLEVSGSDRILEVEQIPLMVDVHEITQLYIGIAPILDPLQLVGVVVFDLHEDVVDIAVAAPEQSEAVAVVDEDVEAEAHAKRVELVGGEQVLLESLPSYFGQGN